MVRSHDREIPDKRKEFNRIEKEIQDDLTPKIKRSRFKEKIKTQLDLLFEDKEPILILSKEDLHAEDPENGINIIGLHNFMEYHPQLEGHGPFTLKWNEHAIEILEDLNQNYILMSFSDFKKNRSLVDKFRHELAHHDVLEKHGEEFYGWGAGTASLDDPDDWLDETLWSYAGNYCVNDYEEFPLEEDDTLLHEEDKDEIMAYMNLKGEPSWFW